MIFIGADQAELLGRQLARSCRDQLAYSPIGGTRSPSLPDGYRHGRLVARLGRGEEAWGRAKDAIRHWQAHSAATMTITPPDAPIEAGVTVLASRAFGPVLAVLPCRIVYGTDEPRRFGFAYGTLPGHPIQGEEGFHVAREADGTVTAEIVSFSRPVEVAARLAGPAGRWVQKTVTARYMDGLRRHVAQW